MSKIKPALTREDVTLLRAAKPPYPPDGMYQPDRDIPKANALRDLADRIEALLPPEDL